MTPPAFRISFWSLRRLFSVVATWTGGSAGIATSALRSELAASTPVLELGYLASEFRGTVTLGRNSGSGLPTYETHFFEFVERERWDRNDPEFLTLDRREPGFAIRAVGARLLDPQPQCGRRQVQVAGHGADGLALLQD